jgi:uncharacterized protein
MTKLLIIAFAVVAVVWLLRRAIAGRGAGRKPDQDGAGGAPHTELVDCAHCGVNLPKAEARSAGGRHYCSEEHWRAGPRDG